MNGIWCLMPHGYALVSVAFIAQVFRLQTDIQNFPKRNISKKNDAGTRTPPVCPT